MNIYLIGLVISLVVYVLVGAWISRRTKTASEYYVSGRQAPTLLIVGSLTAAYLSTGTFMGEAGQSYIGFFALLVIVWCMSNAGYPLGGIVFGRYLRRSEAMTLSEYFGKRFDSRAMSVLATVTGCLTMLICMLYVMQGVGEFTSTITGLPYELSLFIMFVAVALITVLGGSQGVLVTDTIMFLIFTFAMIFGGYFIVQKVGGWNNGIAALARYEEIPGFLSWSGGEGVLYPTKIENLLWALSYGVAWVAVPLIAPWQSSRYLMAKNEHTVIRSAIWAQVCCFVVVFLVLVCSAFVRLINPAIEPNTNVLLWAAMEVMPPIVGTIVLTGVLAAGVSTAITFMSLIGASFANDIMRISDDRKKVLVGKVAIIAVCAIMFLIGYINPPNIWVIMYIGGAVVACSWLPVGLASVWSKRITKAGAFWGMLLGFVVSFVMKLYVTANSLILPIWLDPFYVGLASCFLGMIVGSVVTRPTQKEIEEREKLFIVPESDKDPKEMKKTKYALYFLIAQGAIIGGVLLVTWAIPYMNALR